jgi:hypothetical protein
VQFEGLGQLNNIMTSSGIEPATFRLVAQSFQQTALSRAPMLPLSTYYHSLKLSILM